MSLFLAVLSIIIIISVLPDRALPNSARVIAVQTGGGGCPEGFPCPIIIEGEVVRIEQNTYIVKDDSGKEVRLRVPRGVPPKVGDKIEARVDSNGEVKSLKKSP